MRFPAFRRLKEEWGTELLVLMDSTPAPETAAALVDTWLAAIGGLRLEIMDLEGQQAAAGTAAWPVVPIQDVMDDCEAELRLGGGNKTITASVPSKWLFDEYAKEIASRPEKLKDLLKLRGKFVDRFPVLPFEWGPMRDWLNETFPGESGRTRRNRFDSLKDLLDYAVDLRKLPGNPIPKRSRPKVDSRKGKPLSLELLIRLHQRALAGSLRDLCVWLLRFAMGWRPIKCVRLLAGDVREAVARDDGFIMRHQKHRTEKEERSPSPILPEVLSKLQELLDSLPYLSDDEPLFRSEMGSGKHRGRPLGGQGIRGVVRRLFAAERVKEEMPDAIPYDIRASFATWLGRSVRAGGGSVLDARDLARRLLGHGEGSDPLARYWDDDERHLELAAYSPLRLVLENGGAPLEKGRKLVEIGGLEPPTSALRTPRSPS